MDGKWIAPRPGTDAALALAIAHVWITEGTYDKQLRRRSHGRLRGVQATTCWARTMALPKTPALGGRGIRRAGAHHRRAGARMGAQADDARRRRARRRRRRLPPGLWHRMGAADGAAAGHAGPGQARHRHLGHGDGRAAQQRRLVPRLWRSGRPHRAFASVAQRAAAKNPVQQRLYRRCCRTRSSNPPISGTARASATARSSSSSRRSPIRCRAARKSRCCTATAARSSGTMTDTSKWARMYQSPKLEFVVNQDCWWSAETALCRHHPAGLHAARARRHRRMGRARRPDQGRQQRLQFPRHRAHEEVHRAAVGVEAGLRDLRAAGAAAGRWSRSTRRATPSSTGRASSSRSPTCPSTSRGRSSTARATTSSTCRRTTSRRRRCAGTPRAAPATRPTRAIPKRQTDTGARARHLQRQDRVRVAEPARHFDADDDERPPVPHYHPELGGPSLAGGGGIIRCS